MQRARQPVGYVALIVLALSGVATASGRSPNDCLVLGFGKWSVGTPKWLPEEWFKLPPPRFRLAPLRDTAEGWGRREGWFPVRPAPDQGSDTVWEAETTRGLLFRLRIYDLFAGWRAPAPDSLELSTLAALDYEVFVAGRWRQDTLHARAHSYSDGRDLSKSEPRANAYAVRYRCGDLAAANTAGFAVVRMIAADHSDLAPDRAEEAAERRALDSIFPFVPADSAHRPPKGA